MAEVVTVCRTCEPKSNIGRAVSRVGIPRKKEPEESIVMPLSDVHRCKGVWLGVDSPWQAEVAPVEIVLVAVNDY
jgi:hypothetical protein